MTDIEMVDIPETDTTCGLCFAEFLDSEDLVIHVNQMHNTEPTLIHCQFCGQRFGDWESYASHLRDVHLVRMKCCKYCNRVFDDIASFKRHETKHYLYINKSQYSCSVCKILFHNITELEEHEFKKHKDSGDGVFLRECLPFLSAVLNFNATRFLQTLDEDVVYVCVTCKKSTDNLGEYIDHLKTKNCLAVTCESCCSVYSNKYRLVRHFARHPQCCHQFKRELKQCPECYKMYDIKIWKEHCRNCNAIKCKQCKLVFPSVHDLSNHQRVHPNTVTLTECKFCNKDYAGEAALVKHIDRTHKAEFHLYKYLCIYCNAIFKHPNKLFTHFHTRHKELEPYTCKICNKKFRVRKRFTLHIKLDHKSIGYVEFEQNYHVSFTDKISANPFKPEQLIGKGNDSIESIYLPDAIRYGNSNGQEEIDNLEDKSTEYLDHEYTTIYIDDENEKEMNENANVEDTTKVKASSKKQETIKRGISRKRSTNVECHTMSDSSDDEPLIKLKKTQKRKRTIKLRNTTCRRNKRIKVQDDNKRFICNICKKYCYTYQNYNNHISMHDHSRKTKCVKCLEVFETKADLDKHYTEEHSTSQLTETLRNLLEKRKHRNTLPPIEVSNTEKFMRTIKRVPTSNTTDVAILKINDGLSVQKFIESFTPETDTFGNSKITITPVNGMVREPKIKMTKCNLKHITLTTKLARPVHFKPCTEEPVKATFKLITPDMFAEELADETHNDNVQYGNEEMDTDTDTIPDVAEEIMLEVTEEAPKEQEQPQIIISNVQSNFIMPKIPENCKEVHVAQLQAEAPYFKIIKIDETGQRKNASPPPPPNKDGIELPDGTKLVNVNPLAHLLGDKALEAIIGTSKNKYYKPKSMNIQNAITKAMLKLKTPGQTSKKKKSTPNVI